MFLAKVFEIFFLYIKIFYLTIKMFPRDLKGILLRYKINKNNKKWKNEGLNVAKQFRKNVLKHPNKAAIIFENKTWTFQEVII
jgi:hypothetical protein